MNTAKLIATVLMVASKTAGDLQDGKLTPDEIMGTISMGLQSAGVDLRSQDFKFNLFEEIDGDLHFVVKKEFKEEILQAIVDLLS